GDQHPENWEQRDHQKWREPGVDGELPGEAPLSAAHSVDHSALRGSPATLAAMSVILVTGFEPFAEHKTNPSAEVATALDGRVIGPAVVRSAVLPVHHAEACPAAAQLIEQTDPVAILHLGLAAGRARIALERVAVNVMDFPTPDNAGHLAQGEPCVAGGP